MGDEKARKQKGRLGRLYSPLPKCEYEHIDLDIDIGQCDKVGINLVKRDGIWRRP